MERLGRRESPLHRQHLRLLALGEGKDRPILRRVMTRIAISGPTDLVAEQVEAITRDFEKRINADDCVVSGAAFGVDTIGAKAAKPCGAKLCLTIPKGKWHNQSLVPLADEIIEVDGGYMARNDATADEASCLIAYPPTGTEELRSGTWATIRRFKKRDKPVTIVPLDGLL